LHYEGYKRVEIGKILNKKSSTLRKWNDLWNKKGYDGLKTKEWM
jgi:transposase